MKNRKLATVAILIIVIEIYLQYRFGFCDAVLMQDSATFEYIAQPNQSRFVFGKRMYYNEYSMRSDRLQSSDSLRILGFGDSVLNGGTDIEHDSLATGIIERFLNSQYPERNIRCLNISCADWGPDNCFAYMKEYGDFDAGLIFLVVSSHDAYDNMDFRKVVDVHPDFPSKQSLSATYEMCKYFISRSFATKQAISDHDDQIGDVFNSGFLSFHRYTQEKDIPFFIYLHPNTQEIIDDKYDIRGEEIIRFCRDNNILLIEGLKHENISLFSDAIHLNKQGHRILANILLKEIIANIRC
jgi:lysophospholipase L1-like esterase